MGGVLDDRAASIVWNGAGKRVVERGEELYFGVVGRGENGSLESLLQQT